MTKRLLSLLAVALVACGTSLATVGTWITSAANVGCPELAAISAGGAQVCTGVASLVQAFLELWAQTHPSAAAAMKTTSNRWVRVGNYGYFSPALAAELQQPDCAAALDAYIAAKLKGGGK